MISPMFAIMKFLRNCSYHLLPIMTNWSTLFLSKATIKKEVKWLDGNIECLRRLIAKFHTDSGKTLCPELKEFPGKSLGSYPVLIWEAFCKFYKYYSLCPLTSTFSHIICSCCILSWLGVQGTMLEQNQTRSNLLCLCSYLCQGSAMIGMKRNVKSGCMAWGGQPKTDATIALNWSLLVYRGCLHQSVQS